MPSDPAASRGTRPSSGPACAPAAPRRRAARVVVLVLLAGAIGVGLWSAARTPGGARPSDDGGTPAAPKTGTPAPRTGTNDPGWDPEGRTPGAQGTAPTIRQEPLPPPPSIDDGGTPVKDGEVVPLDIHWRRGERNRHRYELVETAIQQNMRTQEASLLRETTRFTVEVLEGDGAGAAKLRFTLDSFRVQTYRADGFPLDYDSLVPEHVSKDMPEFARWISPRRSILGVPLELTIPAGGGVAGAQNLGEWRNRWADAVDRLEPGKGRDATDLPRIGTFAATWSELLFPQIGTEPLTAGKGRAYRFDQPVPGPWRIAWKGRLDVARIDPDVVRVDLVATPTAEPGEAIVPDPDIAKVHAVGDGDAMRGKIRYSRKTGGVVEAQLDVKSQVWISRPTTAPTDPLTPGYAATFWEVERHLILRRLASE